MDWLFDLFKPNSKMIPTGTDPHAMPGRRRKGGLPWFWIVLAGAGMVFFFGVGIYGMFFRPAPAEALDLTTAPTGTLPNPGLSVDGSPTVVPDSLTLEALLLGASATSGPSPTASVTAWSLLTATPGASQTATFTPAHFLTQLAYDDLNMTATYRAAVPGTIINNSGVDPRVTTIIILASPTWTPWIITATPSVTPYPTYTQFPTQTFTPYPTYTRYPTYTPYPTQTPWILLTSEPLATVLVPVTVVVTATPTDTPAPSETPSETPTPTETPTP